MPHSSTRIRLGVERISPRATPGSVRSSRHIPIEEPLSSSATPRQNKIAAPRQHHCSKRALSRVPNWYKDALSRLS